ncbi:MAG: hypothetical protein MUO43_02890, partial [Desulfobacterales bacterium]|nr:hypothetical protein [Desulfobacterales bacterium]
KAAASRLGKDIDVIKKNAQKTGKTVEKNLEDAGYDPRVASLLVRNQEELAKYAGSVNLEKQEIPREFKQFEAAIAKPKKTQTWAETRALSSEILKDPIKYAKVIKKAQNGQALTAVEIDVSRNININAISELKKMANSNMSPSEFNKSFMFYKDKILNEATSAASSEAGRALNAHKMTVALDDLGNIFKKLKRGMNEREFAEFKALDDTDPAEIKRFMNRLGNPKLSDYLLEYWYNSILSGPPTHLVNVTSNTGWLMWQVPHRALASGVDNIYSHLTGKQRARYLNEIVPMMAGYKAWAKRGAKAAVQMAKSGKVTDFETKWALEIGGAKDAFERSPHAILRKAAPYITAPTRALRAMDVWGNSIAYDGQARSLARRMANQKGLKGKARDTFENNFIKNMPDWAHESAMKHAKYSTFMDEPDQFTNWILGIRKVPVIGPASQLIVPFVNTISNLTKRGLEMTPVVGFLKEGVSRGMGRPHEPAEVIAKQIEGAVITFLLLSKFGEDEMTGPLPSNVNEREAFYRQGKKPWSLKIGDNWYQYRRMEPFNTVIASVAIARDAIKNAKDGETRTDIFQNTVRGVVQNLIDSGYFQSIQQVFNKYGSAKGAIERHVSSWVPYSSFWRSMNRAYEASTEGAAKLKEKDSDSLWLSAFSQVIPGLSGKIPARLDVWGEEIELEGGVFRQWLPYKWATATTDPVELKLEELGVYPGQPYKGRKITIRGEKVEIPKDMYRDFLLYYGHNLKKQMKRTIDSPGFNDYPIERQKKRLDDKISKEQDRASAMLKRQIGNKAAR